MTRILHLTLKKEWFDKIASGEKKEEYREFKLYWKKRLLNREYDEVHFRNGYRKDSPFMRVEYKGCSLRKLDFFDKYSDIIFQIELGKVLEIKNWKCE